MADIEIEENLHMMNLFWNYQLETMKIDVFYMKVSISSVQLLSCV